MSRHAELPKQFAAFVAEVMRGQRAEQLIVAIDGLDELRDPAKPSDAVLTDFLPRRRVAGGLLVVLTTAAGGVFAGPRADDRAGDRPRPDAVRCPIVPGIADRTAS